MSVVKRGLLYIGVLSVSTGFSDEIGFRGSFYPLDNTRGNLRSLVSSLFQFHWAETGGFNANRWLQAGAASLWLLPKRKL